MAEPERRSALCFSARQLANARPGLVSKNAFVPSDNSADLSVPPRLAGGVYY